MGTINAELVDSFYDFENESPGSPIDECEYTRLIETTGSTPGEEQQAPESGFVCASPCSALEGGSRGSVSSSEVQFFDPETSSDTGTEFFDCPPEHRPPPPRRYHHLSHNRVAIRPPSPIVASPSSSSSSATPTSKLNGHVRLLESGESSESLPPSQSTNSISTADSSNFMDTSKLDNSNSNSNSTLQDAAETDLVIDDIVPNVSLDQCSVEKHQLEDKHIELNDIDAEDGTTKSSSQNFSVCKTKFIKYNEAEDDDDVQDDLPNGAIDFDEKEQFEMELDLHVAQAPAVENTPEAEFDQEKVLKEITTDIIESPIEPEVAVTPPEGEQETKTVKKESDEEEYERPPRVRRCSSLKTGKTPPGTPGRKKIVRFADVLGLDLADVRTFLDEVPKIPKSAYEDLDVTLLQQPIHMGPPIEKVLVPLFQQPGCLPTFIDRLRNMQVCLESAAVTDPSSLTITGVVRVRNLDFHKSVHIRYTLDSWRSYSDLTASYVDNSCDGFSDKFSFIMFGNALQIGQRLEMAIRFQAKGEQWWDNNYGANYCFQCLPCSARPQINIFNSNLNSVPSSNNDNMETPSSHTAVGVHTDVLGHRQWSNTFLY